ncbi:Wzz/FepE/Etk N-terminal domain-containing protein [Rhizobium sp. YIM 134829]|uniref:Wzz/FepE/Etk N-terminal domain-containing protein n=1 Tax=Rhizobium sp. YIM 134829 TaxID=3390453 RepID=UPI00397A25A8
MRHSNQTTAASAPAHSLWETAAESAPSRYNWKWVLQSVLGQPMLIGAITAVAVVVAIALVLVRTPTYSASATVQVSNLRLSMSGREDAYFAESLYDPSFVDTQVQIVNSKAVAESVIDSLKIESPPEKPGLIGTIKESVVGLLGPVVGKETEAQAEDTGRAALLRAFGESLSVQRIGQSDLLDIRITDRSAANAAKIANEVAQQYIAKVDADRADFAESGSSWLRTRLQEVGPKARLLSAATTPINKDGMSGLLMVIVAAVIGFAIAVFVALVRELLDTSIRSPEQLRTGCGISCIGMVPTLRGSPETLKGKVLQERFSPLWQTLRQAAVIADGAGLGTRLRMVGFTSTLPGEGKTLMATNFSALMASAGRKVLLVDAQPYHSSVSDQISPAAGRGLIAFLESRNQPVSAFTCRDAGTTYDVLPLDDDIDRAKVSHLLWSGGIDRFSTGMEQYDLIVFDLPPMIASGDMLAASNHLDGLFYVVRWGKVKEAELRSALALVPSVRDALGGALINGVRLRRMRRVFSPEATFLTKQKLLSKKA